MVEHFSNIESGKWTRTRKALAEKYFDVFADAYAEGNLGLVGLLSDAQEFLSRLEGNEEQKEYYREVLNNVKAVLIQDGIEERKAKNE